MHPPEDIGSTAGAAARPGRANGTQAKAVYVFSRPEWSALVTRAGSGIAGLADLMGKRVLAAYERARSWALANPQDVVTILAAAAKLPPDVAVREPGRVDRGNPRVGAPTRAAIAAAAPILKASGSLTAGASLDQAQATLFDNSVATP